MDNVIDHIKTICINSKAIVVVISQEFDIDNRMVFFVGDNTVIVTSKKGNVRHNLDHRYNCLEGVNISVALRGLSEVRGVIIRRCTDTLSENAMLAFMWQRRRLIKFSDTFKRETFSDAPRDVTERSVEHEVADLEHYFAFIEVCSEAMSTAADFPRNCVAELREIKRLASIRRSVAVEKKVAARIALLDFTRPPSIASSPPVVVDVF